MFEGFIQRGSTTVSERDAATASAQAAPDKEGAIRSELLCQIEAAQRVLVTQLNDLRLMGASHLNRDVIGQGSAKLLQLNALRDQLVGGANNVPLTAIRATIASAVADIRAYTSEARNAVAGAQANPAQAATIALQQASESARKMSADFVHEFYDRHEFDKYLQFTSTDDQDEYRKREAERHKAIEDALAKHSPEGNLEANRLAIDQLKDAGTHGADRSPAYEPVMKKLMGTQSGLQEQIGMAARTGTQDRLSAASNSAPAIQAPGLSPDVLAGLKNVGGSGVNGGLGEGHGVTACAAKPTAGRCPT
jgi:hypothetical protein